MTFYDTDLKDQVAGRHELWKIEEAIKFSTLMYRFKDLATGVGRSGYGVDVGIKSLYLQFHYDLSDRELEVRLRFDMAFRWFCGFTAFEETPDHSFFCRFRKMVGTKRIGLLFKSIVKRFGYKGHVSVDMASNMIERIAATPANVSDQQGFDHVCPRSGEMVFGDKAYCLAKAQASMQKRGATSAAILKQNMKAKNKDLDRWRSAMRSPHEGVFSKFEGRARYRGLAKVQLQLFMEAFVWNAKRLVNILATTPPAPTHA